MIVVTAEMKEPSEQHFDEFQRRLTARLKAHDQVVNYFRYQFFIYNPFDRRQESVEYWTFKWITHQLTKKYKIPLAFVL